MDDKEFIYEERKGKSEVVVSACEGAEGTVMTILQMYRSLVVVVKLVTVSGLFKKKSVRDVVVRGQTDMSALSPQSTGSVQSVSVSVPVFTVHCPMEQKVLLLLLTACRQKLISLPPSLDT